MTEYRFTEEELEEILQFQHMDGYQKGRRDMLVTMQEVFDQTSGMGIPFDIDVFFAGITLGLMEAEDLDNGGQ